MNMICPMNPKSPNHFSEFDVTHSCLCRENERRNIGRFYGLISGIVSIFKASKPSVMSAFRLTSIAS
jgi:hypothetical protein